MFDLNSNTVSKIKEEYNALKNGSGIYIARDAAIIQLIGKDTLDFLHRISTNSIKDLNPFEKRNTLFLNEKGRFIDRTTLLNLNDFYMLIGSPDKNKKLFNWINKYIIIEDIQTRDFTDNYLLIDLFGPQSESYLTLLIGDDIKNVTADNVIYTHADGFPFYLFRNKKPSGKIYFNILIEKERSAEFLDYMIENKSVFDVNIVSENAYNTARIECGSAAFPNEINDNFNPHETNLIHEVSFTKGCYIGQEVIARLDSYDKVQRKMVGLILPNGIDSNTPVNILDDEGNDAGEITSIADSELLKKRIALGCVRKKVLNENKNIFVKMNGSKIQLTICELPFRK